MRLSRKGKKSIKYAVRWNSGNKIFFSQIERRRKFRRQKLNLIFEMQPGAENVLKGKKNKRCWHFVEFGDLISDLAESFLFCVYFYPLFIDLTNRHCHSCGYAQIFFSTFILPNFFEKALFFQFCISSHCEQNCSRKISGKKIFSYLHLEFDAAAKEVALEIRIERCFKNSWKTIN